MKVGVIGAGTMGQGIAKAFAQVDGYEVALCDIKQEWAEGGKDKIAKGYARLVQKGKMTQEQVDGILASITPGIKEDLCADCDLIVEAAFENMEVKKTTFGELDKICKPECIFASNTSSLSITEIGNGLTRPMIGMHFFNPAYKSLTLFDEYRHTGFCGRVALFEKGHIFYKCLNGKSCVTHTLDKLNGFAGILVIVTQTALCSRNRRQ